MLEVNFTCVSKDLCQAKNDAKRRDQIFPLVRVTGFSKTKQKQRFPCHLTWYLVFLKQIAAIILLWACSLCDGHWPTASCWRETSPWGGIGERDGALVAPAASPPKPFAAWRVEEAMYQDITSISSAQEVWWWWYIRQMSAPRASDAPAEEACWHSHRPGA